MKKIILVTVVTLIAISLLANNPPEWEFCYEVGPYDFFCAVKQSQGLLYGLNQETKCFFKTSDGANYETTTIDPNEGSGVEITHMDVAMVTPLIGYVGSCVVTIATDEAQVVLYQTTDGGNSWQQLPGYFPGFSVLYLDFISSTEGYLMVKQESQAEGDIEATIYKTTDGGNSWQTVTEFYQGERMRYFKDCHLLGHFNFALIGNGQFIVSQDYCQTWQELELPPITYTSEVDRLSVYNDRLFFSASVWEDDNHQYNLYYSDDFGMSWQPVSTTELSGHYFFMNSGVSWITGQEGHLFNLLSRNPRSNLPPSREQMYIYTSHNNGHSWQYFPSHISSVHNGAARHILYWEDYLYLISGWPTSNIHRAYVGPPVSNSDLVAPAADVMIDCYPNPFKEATKLSLNLKQAGSSLTNISVYNLKGQLVRNLLSQHLSSGQHEIDWDARDNQGNLVSPGMYFFKIKSGKISATKKTVLIK